MIKMAEKKGFDVLKGGAWVQEALDCASRNIKLACLNELIINFSMKEIYLCLVLMY